jgi:preprotein translocase subunit Sss1
MRKKLDEWDKLTLILAGVLAIIGLICYMIEVTSLCL